MTPTLPQTIMAHSLHSAKTARHKLHLIYKWLHSAKAHLQSENNLGFDLSVKTTVFTCLLKELWRCINHFNYWTIPLHQNMKKRKTSGKETSYYIISSPFATMLWHKSSQTCRISELEEILRSGWFKHIAHSEIDMSTSEKRGSFETGWNSWLYHFLSHGLRQVT